MKSLSEQLSSFDDIDVLCEEHGIPCIGLCSNISCQEKAKLLCMKCINSQKTCITKEKHELITISEMLFRFFKKEESNRTNLIKENQNMIKIINEYDKIEIDNIISTYKSIKNEISMKKIKALLFEVINDFIDSFKFNNKIKLKKLKEYSQINDDEEKETNILLQTKLPNIDKNNINDNKTINNLMKEGCKMSSPNIFGNAIKLLNDNNKCPKILNNLNKKIYVNNICENISKRKEQLESNVDSILNELEEKFDEKMKEIKSSIIPQKEKISFNSSSQDSFIRFSSDPNKLIYKGDLCNTAHKFNSIDKVFCAFKSFSGDSYVVWGTPIYSLEFFNIEKNQIINTIKEAHMNIIFSCRHYPDKKNKIDYIITSSYDRNVKIWNLKSFSYNLIVNTHNNNYIYSVCLLFEENENKSYVITSSPSDFMKVWDFTGKLLDRLGLSDEGTYFIDTYYDTKNNIYYILNGNVNDVKSYSFSDRKLYKKYLGKPQSWHMSALVYHYNEQEILIESDGNGFIRLWEFHTSNLIKSIFTYSFILLRGICLWNEKYLFAGANDHQIKLYDLINGKFVKLYKEHTSAVCTLEKIVHNKYGECLLSQALDGKIKIWSSH